MSYHRTRTFRRRRSPSMPAYLGSLDESSIVDVEIPPYHITARGPAAEEIARPVGATLRQLLVVGGAIYLAPKALQAIRDIARSHG